MLPLIILLTVAMMLSAAAVDERMVRENPVEARRVSSYADTQRSFDWFVTSYMIKNPSHTGTLSWTTIKDSGVVPPGMINADLGARFAGFSVKGVAFNYAICSPFSTIELNKIKAVLPQRTIITYSNQQNCIAPT